MRWITLLAADLADYAAAASAVFAAFAVVVTISATRKAQNRAREDRLWQRRADLYVDLVVWATDARMDAEADVRAGRDCAPGFGGATAQLGARLNAFASLDVLKATRAAWDKQKEFCALLTVYRDKYAELLPPRSARPDTDDRAPRNDRRAELGDKIDAAEDAYLEKANQLVSMIHEELKHGRLREGTWD